MASFPNAVAGPSTPPRFHSSNLVRLDAATECPICKSAYASPVSIACGHSFCSRCIRDALPLIKRCPSCNEPAKEGDIRRNRVLEEISDAWQIARPEVLLFDNKAMRPVLKRKPASTASDSTNEKRQRMNGSATPNQGKSRSSSPTKRSRDKQQLDLDGQEDSPILVGENSDLENDEDFAVIDESEEEIEVLEEPTRPDLVECPVCSKHVPIASVNAHLDRGCKDPPSLKGKEDQKKDWKKLFGGMGGGANQAEDMSRLKKLSKPNYNLAKEKELRGMLEEHGLSTGGDKPALAERLQLWISLYNSNLDSSHPKPLKAIRIELERQERAIQRDRKDAKVARDQFTASGIQQNAEDDDAIFRRLTAEVRARKKAAEAATATQSKA